MKHRSGLRNTVVNNSIFLVATALAGDETSGGTSHNMTFMKQASTLGKLGAVLPHGDDQKPDTSVNMTTEMTTNFNADADIALASVAILLVMIGVLGNTTSFVYFARKKVRTLPSHLYTIITAFDTCTALIAFPVIVSLFNSRQDTKVFTRRVPCAIWAVLFYFQKRISVVLVMMMSLTRAIATVFPFRKMTKIRNISIPIAIYALFITIIDVSFLSTGWLKTRFRARESMCEVYPDRTQWGSTHRHTIATFLQVQLLIPVSVVLVSFLILRYLFV